MMPYSDLFWTKFLETFPAVLGAILGLLPAILLVLGTTALSIRAYHQRETLRLTTERARVDNERTRIDGDHAERLERERLRLRPGA
jgi:hypothetical protein